jgi:hypothetical protein
MIVRAMAAVAALLGLKQAKAQPVVMGPYELEPTEYSGGGMLDVSVPPRHRPLAALDADQFFTIELLVSETRTRRLDFWLRQNDPDPSYGPMLLVAEDWPEMLERMRLRDPATQYQFDDVSAIAEQRRLAGSSPRMHMLGLVLPCTGLEHVQNRLREAAAELMRTELNWVWDCDRTLNSNETIVDAVCQLADLERVRSERYPYDGELRPSAASASCTWPTPGRGIGSTACNPG